MIWKLAAVGNWVMIVATPPVVIVPIDPARVKNQRFPSGRVVSMLSREGHFKSTIEAIARHLMGLVLRAADGDHLVMTGKS
jgi:hypothetical protein